ncbi:hypothetical protein Q7267_11720 [Glaesserella parasuis]|uniref:hypothetical protein n=1 Tax=Glaesserella parasuis TaxID=738 RepID=UPI002436B9E2|nr:hypothetical protein [Glaesserella parasuis]MDG6829149.1 hypothetical protein [Glaesserella parasuis]MDO9758056.1 hypothetical protein [Glaesserella parasuis]MDO9927406.1 hypothetical protein [Glaesserella parasuis]MDO9930546.1 hypothetical protein [Glaesserella parasuis]MDO9951002.1 hypothetical protein [Glaesserella parasuis]
MSQSDFIYAVIPSEYQSFFKIETNLNPTEEVIYSLEAFGEAVKRLFALITPQKTISAIFGYRNLSVNFEGISLQYELQAPVLHITLANSWIFFDVINSLELPFEVQVANYAEELVHAFMNTTDEDFTHRIVELICPSVSCCKGYFELR